MISVVIPAFNEERRLPATLDRILEFFRTRAEPFEVIVVSDGSNDGTGAIVRERMGAASELRLIELPVNVGKGHAVRVGLLAARGDLRLFSDADLSTPIEEFERLKGEIDRGADLVIASRALPGATLVVPQSAWRRLLGRCFNLAVRTVLRIPYRDTQCGFKLLRAETMHGVVERLQTAHFGFDFELIYRAHVRGLEVRELPVVWRDAAESKVRAVRHGLTMLAGLWRIRALVRRTECAAAR